MINQIKQSVVRPLNVIGIEVSTVWVCSYELSTNLLTQWVTALTIGVGKQHPQIDPDWTLLCLTKDDKNGTRGFLTRRRGTMGIAWIGGGLTWIALRLLRHLPVFQAEHACNAYAQVVCRPSIERICVALTYRPK